MDKYRLIITGSGVGVPAIECENLGMAIAERVIIEYEWEDDGYKQKWKTKDPHLYVKGRNHWRRCVLIDESGKEL
jgi:hypothetical protein